MGGAGDVYFTHDLTGEAEKIDAAANKVSTLVRTGLVFPQGTAIDNTGNTCIADENQVKRTTHGLIGPTNIAEPLSAGSDHLLPVLPACAPLDAVSDQPWLTITSQAKEVVSFALTATETPRRTYHGPGPKAKPSR